MKINKHIAMWACPRSRSTVITKAFEQLEECVIYDEYFVGPYMFIKGDAGLAAAADMEKLINNMETDYRKVIETITGDLPEGKNFSFQKMSTDFYLSDFGTDWINQFTNFFLIRDPEEIILSLYKGFEVYGDGSKIHWEKIGIEVLYKIFKEVEAMTGKPPLVIHANDVVKNPRLVLQWLCDYLGVTFDEKMLKWEVGLKNSALLKTVNVRKNPDSDPWYATLRNSTTFLPYEKNEIILPEELIPFLEKSIPYYQKLLNYCHVF